MHRHPVRSLLVLFTGLALCAVAAPACAAAALAALEWSAFVDGNAGAVHFDVAFDRPYDEGAGDQLQFWIATDPDPVASVYAVLNGQRPLTTERLFEFRRTPGALDVVAIRTNEWWQEHRDDPNASRGGWGEIIGSTTFTLNADRMDFDVPFALLGSQGEPFYFEFETYQNGAWGGVTYWASSGSVWTPDRPVPEPQTAAQMLMGLSAIAAARACAALRARAAAAW